MLFLEFLQDGISLCPRNYMEHPTSVMQTPAPDVKTAPKKYPWILRNLSKDTLPSNLAS